MSKEEIDREERKVIADILRPYTKKKSVILTTTIEVQGNQQAVLNTVRIIERSKYGFEYKLIDVD